ncbi:MAG: DnaJ domain-containing protein [candidate division WOR-3 bacterium]|nr:MAG: DnaJ domain-containing protein [candidate division WOR-3 bacterium]
MSNFYEVLGVSQNATITEIKRVYLALAQKYHPDKFTDENEKKEASEIFSRVTAAYRTLSDEKLRAKYDQSLAKHTTDADEAKEIQAKNLFNRASEHIDKGEHWPALNLLKTAYSYDRRPLYLSYMGLMQVYTKRNQSDGFKKLEHAIKTELFNPVMHYNLGLAYESVGKEKEALRAYQQALNWNSKYTQAKVAIGRLRKKKKGMFSRLFGGDQ